MLEALRLGLTGDEQRRVTSHYTENVEAYQSYVLLAVHSDLPPRDSFQKAKTAAMRALEIDDTNAEAHTALAHVRFWYDWD